MSHPSGQVTDRQTEYREVYLRSDHWRRMRALALEDAEHRCAVCNEPKRLDVHHRTYERLGNERLTDLLVLCRGCHDLFHQSRHVVRPKPTKPRKRRRQRKGKKLKTANHPGPSPDFVRRWIEEDATAAIRQRYKIQTMGDRAPLRKQPSHRPHR